MYNYQVDWPIEGRPRDPFNVLANKDGTDEILAKSPIPVILSEGLRDVMSIDSGDHRELFYK